MYIFYAEFNNNNNFKKSLIESEILKFKILIQYEGPLLTKISWCSG